jgi:methionyl-tRNA formyltransferase
LAENAPPSRHPDHPPVTAVFFLHLSAMVLPMIRTWLERGNRISAIVVYRQKQPTLFSAPVQWLSLQWIVLGVLRRHRIPLIDPPAPLDWRQLREQLAAGRPDVAITYGFLRLIPEELRSIFPRGAVNFHPALLPHYRGPKPFHWLAIGDDWRRCGGVTLHEMTDAFDMGPIVAQAAMSDAGMPDQFSDFVSDSLACMTGDVIPGYCAGQIKAWPQPAGAYVYAGMDVPQPVVQPDWTRRQLQLLCAVFRKRPGVTIETPAGCIRLLAEARRLGPPSGAPPVSGRTMVEFDLADGRVAYWRHTPASKFLLSLAGLPRRLGRRMGEVPIRLGPFQLEQHADD